MQRSIIIIGAATVLTFGMVSCQLLLEPEGRNAGECSDAADNDGDGLFDCDDSDCAGSPDCVEEEYDEPEDSGPLDTGDGDTCEDYTYEAYAEDSLEAVCDKWDECGLLSAHFTYEDCLAIGDMEDTANPWECEDFDCDAAQRCVQAFNDVSCEDFEIGHGTDICDQVCSNF